MNVGMVIPTYNERENLADLVQSLLNLHFPAATLRLFIVDDASPDGTGDIADALAEAHAGRIHVVHRVNERGRASAGIAGFKCALADPEITHVGEMDADFSHDPNDLPALVAAAAHADVVIGSRYVAGGKAINCAPINVFYSRVINVVNRALLGVRVKDSSGGYKIYSRRVLSTINLCNYVSKAYSVGVETLLKCQRHGFSLVEVPITFRNRVRGHSKVNWRILTEYPVTVLRLKVRLMQGRIS
jgi:dolichol-phosphate mannosyltransferase